MQSFFDPADLDKIRDDDLLDIWQSIQEGAKTPAEAYGFDEPAMVSVERAAHGYYTAQKFAVAGTLYGFLLRMDSKRSTAWRGLGACAHAIKQYELAVNAFRGAVECAPNDGVAQIFLGEALCQIGEKEEGLAVLNAVLQWESTPPQLHPYLKRAQTIVEQGGGMPNRSVLQREGMAVVQAATQAQAQEGDAEPEPLEYDEDRDIEWSDMQKNPELMAVLKDVQKAVSEGRLTLAEVGGFTDNELDGAYAVCCKYVEMGQVVQAMQIVGYLIFIDPYKSRYYQLTGICMQRLQQYEGADHFYRMALSLDKNDPMSMVYQGECKILSGELDSGLEIIKEAVVLAQDDPVEHHDILERAQALIKQFSV